MSNLSVLHNYIKIHENNVENKNTKKIITIHHHHFWHDNSWWVLVSSRTFFHLVHLWARAFQPFAITFAKLKTLHHGIVNLDKLHKLTTIYEKTV